MELMKAMLEKDPKKRINVDGCLQHPFLEDTVKVMIEAENNDSSNIDEIDEDKEIH